MNEINQNNSRSNRYKLEDKNYIHTFASGFAIEGPELIEVLIYVNPFICETDGADGKQFDSATIVLYRKGNNRHYTTSVKNSYKLIYKKDNLIEIRMRMRYDMAEELLLRLGFYGVGCDNIAYKNKKGENIHVIREHWNKPESNYIFNSYE